MPPVQLLHRAEAQWGWRSSRGGEENLLAPERARSWRKAEEEGGCLAAPSGSGQSPARSGQACSVAGQQGRVPPRPARPTVGVLGAGLAVLQGHQGTGLTLQGAFTAVQLSHRWWPWQVFNDLDFNWMEEEGRDGEERERKREGKGLEKKT